MFIYEIGAITWYNKTDQMYRAMNWRKEIDLWAKDNYIETFNPAITYEKELNQEYNLNLCVVQNDYYINKCDIAIINLDNLDKSPGSIYELVRFKLLNKPVIAFGECDWSKNPHIASCITQTCKNLEDVLNLISIMFDQ